MAQLNNLTKDQLAEEIMDVLALDLESLTRMTKEDLVKLCQAVETLKSGEGLLDKPLKDILDQKIGGKPVRDLTLGEIVSTVRDEGPLGLGILPEIRRVIRNEIKPEIRRLIRGRKKTEP